MKWLFAILAAVFVMSQNLAMAAEPVREPIRVDGALAETLWEAMGLQYTKVSEGVHEKAYFTTCVILDPRRPGTICRTLGSDSRIMGPAADTLYSILPKKSQSHDGKGGVFRGARITCQAHAGTTVTYVCYIPNRG